VTFAICSVFALDTDPFTYRGRLNGFSMMTNVRAARHGWKPLAADPSERQDGAWTPATTQTE